MKLSALTIAAICIFSTLALAGPERASSAKEVQAIQQPACDWYRANEWDVNIWGAFAFPANTGQRDIGFFEGPIESGPDPDLPNSREDFDVGRLSSDRFINRDSTWALGLDIKYFWTRYLGGGVEGFVVDSRRNMGGAALGTFTFRYPIGCSRFAPYFVGGIGVLGGGSHTERIFSESIDSQGNEHDEGFREPIVNENDARFIGQVGAGLEIRLTHPSSVSKIAIGLIGDFTWNFVQDADNDFGMARGGLNFSF